MKPLNIKKISSLIVDFQYNINEYRPKFKKLGEEGLCDEINALIQEYYLTEILTRK